MSAQSDIAVIGLAVMGQNLILNMNDHGFKVTAYNRTYAKTEAFLAGTAKDTQITGAKTLSIQTQSMLTNRTNPVNNLPHLHIQDHQIHMFHHQF